MKRRDLLIVLAAVGGAAAFKLRPSHRGAPYDPYFAGLDALLALQEVEDPLVGRRQAFARTIGCVLHR